MELIPIDRQLESFDAHLAINERTILSAKFGDGKTYFLNEFKLKYEKQYYFVTLYPVNYSVAENADVFEYIKRDILLQLANDEMLNPIDLDAAVDSVFNWNTLKEVINFLLTFLPQGDILKKIMEKAEKFKKKYDEKKTDFNKYNEVFENKRGGIYEYDGYTQLIEKTLQYIQENKGKKTVLIIEDLDRIDPAHLFRILNVLGSHFDCRYNSSTTCTSNKFGFSNIVTVFDFDVTKHIFSHFYGNNANYEGYINKFKICQPFYYSITDIARSYLQTYIEENCNIKFEEIKDIESALSIKDLINSLTVRDIYSILNNIDKQIKNEDIKSFNQDYHFQTLSPLTRFIVILIRMGIKKREINRYITSILLDINLFNLVGTFLTLDHWFCTQQDIRHNSANYEINMKREGKTIISLTFTPSTDQKANHSNYSRGSSAIFTGINKALEYILE